MIEDEFLPAEPRGTFLGHVNVVVATYALDGALAFAQGVLIARALGPDGRGVYSLFVVSAAFAQVVLALGLGNASIYYLNKRAVPVRSVVSATHVVAIWSLAATALAIVIIRPWTGDALFGGDVPDALFIAAVPLLVYSTLLKLVLQAMSRFVELGAVIIVQPIVMLALSSVTMATGDATPSKIIVFWIIAHVVTALIALVRIGLSNVDLGQIVRPRWATLRSLLGFGIQGEAGNVLQLLNYRLDQYLVRAFVSLAGLTLIPAFGVNGAAAASSLTYVAHFAAALVAYRIISGQPALDAVVPRAADARLYVDAARSVISKLSRRTSMEADVVQSTRR